MLNHQWLSKTLFSDSVIPVNVKDHDKFVYESNTPKRHYLSICRPGEKHNYYVARTSRNILVFTKDKTFFTNSIFPSLPNNEHSHQQHL